MLTFLEIMCCAAITLKLTVVGQKSEYFLTYSSKLYMTHRGLVIIKLYYIIKVNFKSYYKVADLLLNVEILRLPTISPCALLD